MSARKVDLLLPLLVVVIACGAVALVVGLTGTAAEPGPPTPFEQEDPPAPQTGLFPTDKITVPLKDLPPMPLPFGLSGERPPQKSVEEMTPEELELHNKIEALKERKNLFKPHSPLRKITDEREEDGMWPESVE
jgi:hypothetical protein